MKYSPIALIVFFLVSYFIVPRIDISIYPFIIAAFLALFVAMSIFYYRKMRKIKKSEDYDSNSFRNARNQFRLGVVLSLCLCGVFAVSLHLNSDSYKADREIKRQIAQCPINQIWGTITDITISDNAINADVRMKYNADSLSIELMTSAIIEFELAVHNDANRLSSIADYYHLPVRVSFYVKTPGDGFDRTWTENDLQRLIDLDGQSLMKMNLDNAVAITNLQLPVETEEYMVLDSVYLDGKNMVYQIVLDENVFDIPGLRDNRDRIRQQRSESFIYNVKNAIGGRSPAVAAVINNDLNVVFRWKGSVSGDTLNLHIATAKQLSGDDSIQESESE